MKIVVLIVLIETGFYLKKKKKVEGGSNEYRKEDENSTSDVASVNFELSAMTTEESLKTRDFFSKYPDLHKPSITSAEWTEYFLIEEAWVLSL